MDCPFCLRVAAGDFDRSDDVGTASFEPLNPVTDGHRLFVPFEHLEHGQLGSAHAAGRAVEAALAWGRTHGVRDLNIITSSGRAATQTVPHLHIHLVPRRLDDGLHLPWTGQVRN